MGNIFSLLIDKFPDFTAMLNRSPYSVIRVPDLPSGTFYTAYYNSAEIQSQ